MTEIKHYRCSQGEKIDVFHKVEVELNELDSQVLKLKQNIKELESKIESFTKNLNAFKDQLMDFKKKKKSLEIKTSKFKKGFQRICSDGIAEIVSTASPSLSIQSRMCSANESESILPEALPPTKHSGPQGDFTGKVTETMPHIRIVLPDKFTKPEEYIELKSCYEDIVTNMPDNYMETVQLLEQHLCNMHSTKISECTSAIDANQKILECLFEKLTCKADFLDVCEILLSLNSTSQLLCIVKNLKITIMENLKGTQSCEKPNAFRSKLLQATNSTDNATTVSKKEVTTKVHLTHQQSGNSDKLNLADKMTNGNFEVTLDDIRSCDEVKRSKPTNVYIQRLVTQHYAKHWKQIGLHLGVNALDTIEADHQNDVKGCCRVMISQWLDMDTTATWKKLLDAIDIVEKTYPNNNAVTGLLFQAPPPLPTFYIERPKLLEEIAEKVLSSEIDNTVHVTVVITGMAGFGKSTLAIALCHHPRIKKCFASGFLRISLGQISKNKGCLLTTIYQKLTGRKWANPVANIQGKITEYEKLSCLSEELNTLCNPNLLIIIDDVWDVRDAIDYAEIFSGCKIIITTRRKDVALKIHCKHKITVDSMTASEAVQLLTHCIEELQDTNTVISNKLNELASNLLNWPLLLHLVRAQLDAKCTYMPNSPLCAIEQVTKKLFDNGLTAFDPNGQTESDPNGQTESDPNGQTKSDANGQTKPDPNTLRKEAANASIKASLELVSQINLSRINKLVRTYSFNNATPKSILNFIWEVNEEELTECCTELWSAGLISYTSNVVMFVDIDCIELHAVITQYLFDNFKTYNVVQVLVDFLLDVNINTKYLYELSKIAEKIFLNDISAYSLFIIDMLDVQYIPIMIKSHPLILQTLANFFTRIFKDISSDLKIPNTFMRVRHKYVEIISLLNDGETEKVLACFNEPIDKFAVVLQQISYFLHSIPMFSHICFGMSLEKLLPELISKTCSVYINCRSNIKTLINAELLTKEKLFCLLRDVNIQLNEIVMPEFQRFNFSEIFQLLLSVKPDLQSLLQPLRELFSQLQSTDSKLSLADLSFKLQSYISQHRNELSYTECNII